MELKTLLLFTTLLFALARFAHAVPTGEADTAAWNLFKFTHNKRYASSDHESARKQIWASNVKMIDEHNQRFLLGQTTYEMGMNHLGDLSALEINKMLNGYREVNELSKYYGNSPNDSVSGSIYKPAADYKRKNDIDWRKYGVVTRVKNQGKCSTCWAFAATGAIEAQQAWKIQRLVSLSEQNLFDCVYKDHNCRQGGSINEAFEYAKRQGIDTENSYPYHNPPQKGSCRFNRDNVGARVVAYTGIRRGSEDDLQDAVSEHGPVSVAINVPHSFYFYKSGLFYDNSCSSTQLDHAVLVVGYGSSGNGKFYIVKNSWSTGWGEQGYVLMSRERNNNCGIATAALFPRV